MSHWLQVTNRSARCKQSVARQIRKTLTRYSRYEERVPEPFQHREPVHRYYREEPVVEGDGRPRPLHPRRMEDVIVLE
jgi:hypothetical protein